MRSRLPSVWPAYLGKELLFFDDASLKARQYTYNSNYGLFPANVSVSTKPNSGLVYSEYSVECGGDSFVLSWYHISQWYYFFKEYFHLLNDYGHCGRAYYNAMDYYTNESVSYFANEMKYGADEETYLEIDEMFAKRGGNPLCMITNRKDCTVKSGLTIEEAKVSTQNEGSDEWELTEISDNGFYKWLSMNVVPTFEIPNKYRERWNKGALYYPDVVSWVGWFQPRNELYKGFDDANSCSTATDCCDCVEYFERGGMEVYNSMIDWYSGVSIMIAANKEKVSNNAKCFCPMFFQDLMLQGELKTQGEESVLASEYELGIDYRTAASTSALTNTKGGTVVTVDGESKILKNGHTGFLFDNCFMEKYYDEEGFDSYTEQYVSSNSENFVPNVKYYAFTSDGKRWTSSALSEVDAKNDIISQYEAANTHEFTTNGDEGWLMIDGNLCPIEKTEYGTSLINGKRQFVYRERFTDTPYTFLNGEKVYGSLDLDNNVYRFSIFKESYPIKSNNIPDNKLITFALYKGSRHMLSWPDASGVIINSGEYAEKVLGYADFENERYYHVVPIGTSDTIEGIYTLGYFGFVDAVGVRLEGSSVDALFVKECDDDLSVHAVNVITGQTISKIYDLRPTTLLVDDIGNTIQGLFDNQSEANSNAQPSEGMEIEPIYQVGNVANITPYIETILDKDEAENMNQNYFVGDIITEMRFYWKDGSGSIVENTVQTVALDNNFNGKWTSLDAIKKSYAAKESNTDIVFEDDIYCDITYYCGATLQREKGKSFYTLAPNKHNGVKYSETVRFVKTNTEYYLRKPSSNVIPTEKNNASNHSVSYPIWCYILTQDMTTVTTPTYNRNYEAALANFTVNIFTYTSPTKTSYDSLSDMALRNGTEVYPTFMEEYKIGVAAPPMVNANIDVDRGINAAFEKHIKLGEVTSLEAMELYGNGYFKMMES